MKDRGGFTRSNVKVLRVILDFFEDFCLVIKRRQERKPFREFTEILQYFFFTSLPNKSILSDALSMTLSFIFPWTYPNFFISISSRSQDSKG